MSIKDLAKSHLLPKLLSGAPVNLMDYTGNLQYDLCYAASWELFGEKDPAVQAEKAKVIVTSLRNLGQEAWANKLVNNYFPRFKINYTEAE